MTTFTDKFIEDLKALMATETGYKDIAHNLFTFAECMLCGTGPFNKKVRVMIEKAGFAAEYINSNSGEDYWSVVKFTRGNESIYVKFVGYGAYDGAIFDKWFFVEPREVVVTQMVEFTPTVV